MSDISTNLSMQGKPLFSESEFLTCSMFNFKMFLFVLTMLICISCISMLFAPTFITTEAFTNNVLSLDKLKLDLAWRSEPNLGDINYDYQSVALTSNNNLIFGQANRYITSKSYTLDIYANLYVINGSPFGKSKQLNEKYVVYLKNASEKKEIGQLKKDGDGLYKIHFKSNDPKKYVKYNEIEITLGENTFLNGKFKIV